MSTTRPDPRVIQCRCTTLLVILNSNKRYILVIKLPDARVVQCFTTADFQARMQEEDGDKSVAISVTILQSQLAIMQNQLARFCKTS